MIVLSSVVEAVEYLELLQSAPPTIDFDIRFAGELEAIRIDIDGPAFHHSITGELSRGLAAYQDEIYKAAKFAIYGREGRIQLTAEQRAAFELVFEVREGSTDLIAPVQTLVEGLAAGLSTMEPTMLAIVIIVVVVVLVGGYVAVNVLEGIQETKQKKDTLDAEVKRGETTSVLVQRVTAEQTAIAAVLVGSKGERVVQRFENAQTEGVKQVLRSVPTATEVTFGDIAFDSDDIKELRRRSPRAKSEYVEVIGNFRVFADTNITPTRLTLSGADLPGEFNVDFPEDLDAQQTEWLWVAIRGKSVLPLEVGATIIREKVKSGVILDVLGSIPLPTAAASR